MEGFKLFLEESAEKEAQESIKRLPKAHRELVRGYKFYFEPGCTLKHYPDSVGLVQLEGNKKIIKVAAPWNYGREFALLHEIGHLVYEKYMANNPKLKKKWQKIVDNTKHKVNQNAEELFCHAYANTYAKNKITKHDHDDWEKFIKKVTS